MCWFLLRVVRKNLFLVPLLFRWFVRNLWHSFPVVKNLPANAGNTGGTDSIPRSGRSPGEEGATFSSVLFLIYFNWRLIALQYCGGFCHTLTWIRHGCTCVPHPEPPSHLPPHPIPQGHPSAPALSILSHASNLGWRSISHMVIYLFQCYSLKSSHPRLLPQSLQYPCLEIPRTPEPGGLQSMWLQNQTQLSMHTILYLLNTSLQSLPWYSCGVLPVCVRLCFQVNSHSEVLEIKI